MASDSSSSHALGGGLTTVADQRSFLDRIRNAFDVLLFRPAAVDEVVGDPGAFAPALAIVVLAGIAAAAGSGAWLIGYVGSSISYLLLSLLFAATVHLGATLVLGARNDFVAFYRGVGYTYLGLWIAGIPVVNAFLIWALWAWHLAAVVFVAERCYRLERVQAAAVVCIPAAIGIFLALMFNGMVALATLVGGWAF